MKCFRTNNGMLLAIEHDNDNDSRTVRDIANDKALLSIDSSLNVFDLSHGGCIARIHTAHGHWTLEHAGHAYPLRAHGADFGWEVLLDAECEAAKILLGTGRY